MLDTLRRLAGAQCLRLLSESLFALLRLLFHRFKRVPAAHPLHELVLGVACVLWPLRLLLRIVEAVILRERVVI